MSSGPEFIVVNLTSVYDPADLSSSYVLSLSTEELRRAGLDIARVVKGLKESVPTSRGDRERDPDGEGDGAVCEHLPPLPGCDRDGGFCVKPDGLAASELGEEDEVGSFGLRWSNVHDLSAFTEKHWCIVINAYMDE